MKPSPLLEGLNEEQTMAVTHGEGPLLIVAGAGTGKTTVITRRIAWLIEQQKCKPEEILALTFTDKAAGEMEERVDRLLPYGYVNLWISTFHSFCERILSRHALDIGLPNDFTLLDTTASWLLVRKNLDRFNLDYYRPLGNPTKFIHALLKHFSRCKDEGITPERYIEHAQGLQLDADATPSESLDEGKNVSKLAGAYHVYQQLLLEREALDFGDLILHTVRLFQKRPAILERYQKAFPYVLVDEFQDTNAAQYELVKMIARPKNNLTAVGDDDQAIFRWRGASFHNILSFKNDYPHSVEIALMNNYRSPQNILDAAYAFIQQNNPNRLEYQLQGMGRALSKCLVSADTLPGVLENIHCATHEEEVEAVIAKISSLKAEQGISFGDSAILVRSNDTAGPFLAALDENLIPHHFLALKGLYAKPIIVDVVSFLKALANPHDSPALYRVLTWPLSDVGHSGIVELSHHAHQKGKTLWSALLNVEALSELSQDDRERMLRIRGLIEKLGAKSRHSRVSELFLLVLKETGLLASVSGDESPSDRENLALLNELFAKIKAFQQSEPSGRLADFLSLLALEQEAGDAGSLARLTELDADSVKVMTIHASKGLEFPYVFVVHMVDKRFPTIERGDAIPLPDALVRDVVTGENAHLEEERRLMYVALTRAKRGIFLTCAEDYGGARKRKPSQFLAELGLLRGTDYEVRGAQKGPQNQLAAVTRTSSQSGSRDSSDDRRLALPHSFSFSQITAFRACPLQYKFSFLLKIPTFGKPSLSFGKSVHATLQKFVELLLSRASQQQGSLFTVEPVGYTARRNAPPSLDELLELYKASWNDDWYPSRKAHDEYFEKGLAMLKRFHGDFVRESPTPKTVERDFVVKIGGLQNLFTLKGRIDRIDSLPDGSIEIIDYKTGKTKDGHNVPFADKEQLLLYQLAAGKVLGERVSKLTYCYLEDGTKISFLGSEKEQEKLSEKMIETLNDMKTSTFSATPGWHCQYCDFRDICEFRA